MQNLAYDLNDLRTNHRFPYTDCQEFLNRNEIDRPYFLFCKDIQQKTSLKFQKCFPGEVSYAVKANPEKIVLQALWESGIRSYDVASIGEIRLLRRLFPECHLHYNNPVRSPRMITEAYELHGVRSFVIDDELGLELLKPYCTSDMEITVRFKLAKDSSAYDFGSKFGSTPEVCVELLTKVESFGVRSSLTFHPGSQCTDHHVYGKYIAAAAELVRGTGVKLYRLNVGGGFPVAYQDSNIATIEEYFQLIADASETYFGADKPELLCEPGRAMVASSVSLLSEVIHVRDNGDVFINDGVYGGLQEQVIMKTQLPLKVWRDGGCIDIETGAVHRRVFGPTCDPVDILSTAFPLPKDIKEGDCIEFGLIGAYGSATSTRFNGFEPAQYVSVNNGFFKY